MSSHFVSFPLQSLKVLKSVLLLPRLDLPVLRSVGSPESSGPQNLHRGRHRQKRNRFLSFPFPPPLPLGQVSFYHIAVLVFAQRFADKDVAQALKGTAETSQNDTQTTRGTNKPVRQTAQASAVWVHWNYLNLPQAPSKFSNVVRMCLTPDSCPWA